MLLEKHNQPSCTDGADNEEEAQIKTGFNGTKAPFATKAGLVFGTEFPHASEACEQEITLPYEQIAPYLTPEGKKALAYYLGVQFSGAENLGNGETAK